MCNQLIYRWAAVVLLCSLPMPALAQLKQGLQVPVLDSRSVASQTQPKPRDHDKDSLRNGAIIGAIVLGTWCLIVCGQGLDSSDQLAGVVALNAGLGALIGAGIDARFSRRHRIMFRWRF